MSKEGKVGEMKPCPFCGGDAEYDSDRWNGMRPVQTNCGHAVYCSKCPLPDVGGTPIFETKEEAVEYWNRRAPTPSADGASVVVPVDLVQRAVIALQEVGQQAFAVDLLNTLRPHAQLPTRKGYTAVNEAFRRAESEKTILKQTIREMNTPPAPAGDAEAVRDALTDAITLMDEKGRSVPGGGSVMLWRREWNMLRATLLKLTALASQRTREGGEVMRLREALEAIQRQDETEIALDPDWPRRIARAALTPNAAPEEISRG